MRIDVIMLISGVEEEALKRRQEQVSSYASPGTEVHLVLTRNAPLSVESQAEMELAAPGILERAVLSEREGADAVVIWGGHDPSVASARELVSIPVVGPGMASMYIASALAEAFGCGVNDLPLTLVLSWYEQKAVAILLTLLQLGIRNIKLGPSLPAFLTPEVVQILVDKFAIAPISTPQEDLAAVLK